MNEIVKYHNDLTELPLRKFTANELDLFMVLCNKLKDKGTNEIVLSFDDIKELANYKAKDNHRLAEDIRRTNKKLLELNIMLRDKENPGRTVQFALFSTFITDENTLTLEVSVNAPFKWILNELIGVENGYTSFELHQFVGLKSSYSKACYRQLKRYKDTGFWKVSIGTFRDLMDIPISYSNAEITRKVLKPIEEELPGIFKYFFIEKKYGKGRGKPIEGFEFHFEPEIRWADDAESEDKTNNISKGFSYKKTDFKCPECGRLLYSKIINGNLAYCHNDGYKDNAICKEIFNSVKEINKFNRILTLEQAAEIRKKSDEEIERMILKQKEKKRSEASMNFNI